MSSADTYPATVRDASQAPLSQQSDFTARIDAKPLSLDDIELPGLGEPGESCGSDKIPEKEAICPNGDAIRYEPLRCRRVACPDCYASEDRERAFQDAVRIEGTARLLDERPHALAWSPHPRESRYYSIDDINRMMKRGRRRSKALGVLGGVSVVHPARLEPGPKARLVGHGYGSGGVHGELGSWMGVRRDALDLGDWREYARYEPHGHSIGFPGFIESHEGDGSFIVEKYGTLDDVGQVVNHVEYLMHHRMAWRGEGQFTAVRPWGMMHPSSNDYLDVEAELGAEAYASICRAVASELGGEWSPDEGLHYPDEGEPECPSCGLPKSEFFDLYELPRLAASKRRRFGGKWMRDLSDTQRAFFKEIIEILNHDQSPRIHRGDVIHPDDVAVWIDEGDRPPPT